MNAVVEQGFQEPPAIDEAFLNTDLALFFHCNQGLKFSLLACPQESAVGLGIVLMILGDLRIEVDDYTVHLGSRHVVSIVDGLDRGVDCP